MAAGWVTITLSDLNHYLVAAQVAALNTAGLAAGQSDRFTRQRDDVVARIRNAIESGGGRVSATAGAVPPELRWAACYLIIAGLQSGVPGLRLSDDQERQAARAADDLSRVSAGRLKVSEPTDPLVPPDIQARGGTRVVRQTERLATRETLAEL